MKNITTALNEIKLTIGAKLNDGEDMYSIVAEMIESFGKDIATLILVDVAIGYGRIEEAKIMMQRHFPEEYAKRTK